MTTLELTNRANTAKTLLMQGTRSWKRRSLRGSARTLAVMMGMGGALALGGCVSVNAPDKPIVIELNINISRKWSIGLPPTRRTRSIRIRESSRPG